MEWLFTHGLAGTSVIDVPQGGLDEYRAGEGRSAGPDELDGVTRVTKSVRKCLEHQTNRAAARRRYGLRIARHDSNSTL